MEIVSHSDRRVKFESSTHERTSAVRGADDAFDAEALDTALPELREGALRWAATSPGERAFLFERVIADTHAVGLEWNAAACRANGLDPDGPDRPPLDIERVGQPRYPDPVRHRHGNRLSVRVMPASLLDGVLFTGDSAEVWMEPGVDEATMQATQATAYADLLAHAGVNLVLGAGNVAAVAPQDVGHKLIGEGRVVIVKANAVNDYLVGYWQRALAAFVEAGDVRIVTGDARVGKYLVHHHGVDDVHITGSEFTDDAGVHVERTADPSSRGRYRRGLSRIVVRPA